MANFLYQAVTDSGQRVQGSLRCAERREAVRQLRERGYHPIRLEVSDATIANRSVSIKLFQRITTYDLAVFTRQLGALLKAGMPILQALSTVRKQSTNQRIGVVVEDIEETLSQQAGTFTDALRRHPKVFDPVYRGLVHSGEESGKLPEVLGNIARHLTQAAKLRGQVVGAFIYPAFLLVLGGTAVFVLMSFVIPKFEQLFVSLNQELPLPTRILIAMGHFMGSWWWAILIGVTAILTMIIASLRKLSIRQNIDSTLLRTPVIGAMLTRVEAARVSRTLAALVDGGIRIVDALRITGHTVRNLSIKAHFDAIVRTVSTGDPVATAFEKAGVFPPMMVNLIRTGEETGDLPAMLKELAEIYEDEAERAVTGAVRLLEPLLILLMGGLIAGIVAAVILPVFQANATIS